MSKKVLAVILSLILAFSVVAVPVAAADTASTSFSIENIFNTLLDKFIAFILTYLNDFWPGYEDEWVEDDGYVPENFYTGEETFDKSVDTNAKWEMGYAGASLLEGIEPLSGDFYLAGTLEPIIGRTPVKVLDDQRVRVYALSDGVSGVVVQAVIDGFGLSRGDVQEIRARLTDFAAKYNIVSINVSVLHQHSCIDTLGMNVPLAPALIFNTGNAATSGMLENLKVEKNQEFMENLYAKTVLSIKKAVVNMKEGTLSYGYADIADYVYDKRDPQALDTNIHRLRFAPEDGTRETWVIQGAMHCTMMGAGPDVLTADYPYYIEKAIRETEGANVVYVMGAELAIRTETGTLNLPEGTSDEERMALFGEAVAEKVMAIDNDIALDPVLNIKMKEVRLDVTNEILTLAAREDVINPVIVKVDGDYQMVTEIGYMELGNKVAVFIAPGEFDPILVFGGPESGDAAWFGSDWEYPAMKDLTPCEYVMVYGLCNDQAGYVLRDNEYHSMFTENEEINVVSQNAGSIFVNAYTDLVNSVA